MTPPASRPRRRSFVRGLKRQHPPPVPLVVLDQPAQLPSRRLEGLVLAAFEDHLDADPGEVTVQARSEEHTSELQSPCNLVCRLLLEKKKKNNRGALVQEEHNELRRWH